LFASLLATTPTGETYNHHPKDTHSADTTLESRYHKEEDDDEDDDKPTSSSSSDSQPPPNDAQEDDDDAQDAQDLLDVADLLADLSKITITIQEPPPPPKSLTLSSPCINGIADLILSNRVKNIICMCGAGISVSAGIPDFRTPGTGLYYKLQEYNLPYPQAVFEIDFFKKNPHPFYLLAKELYPGQYRPTPTHFFLRLLHEKRLLLRCFTQNIDSLECVAGLPRDAVVAAHGNFDTAHCIECKREHDVGSVKEAVQAGKPHRCSHSSGGNIASKASPSNSNNSSYSSTSTASPSSNKKGNNNNCNGLVKPGIVFFGENLPKRFFQSAEEDFPQADLLIVLGTSLVVNPFASLIDKVSPGTPRLLINREKVGETHPSLKKLGVNRGFDFTKKKGGTDALFLGDCDEGVRQLCEKLGWGEDLERVMKG
jgi:NAD-dependent deacetylase sirtuin 2